MATALTIMSLTLPIIGLAVGAWLLFRVRQLPQGNSADSRTVSIVIPARNEAHHIGELVASAFAQTPLPHEVIVVDDGSVDGTAEVARAAGATVLVAEPLPDGWNGKIWACASGTAFATGEVLLFLDADTLLHEGAIASLLTALDERGGLVSAQPFHRTERLYEQLSAPFNLISFMAVGAGRPIDATPSGAFGPCLIATRADYDAAGGHEGIAGELLDDIKLASAFEDAGLPVTIYGGGERVSFRMYPLGVRSLIEGWSKNMSAGSSTTPVLRLLGSFAVIAGSLQAPLELTGIGLLGWQAGAIMTVIYALNFFRHLRLLGDFRWYTSAFYPVVMIGFLLIFVRSVVLTVVRRRVQWKGRHITIEQS